MQVALAAWQFIFFFLFVYSCEFICDFSFEILKWTAVEAAVDILHFAVDTRSDLEHGHVRREGCCAGAMATGNDTRINHERKNERRAEE